MISDSEYIHTVRVEQGEYLMYLPNASVDYIQKNIANTQKPYELAMLEDMATKLNPGDVVLDVGANVGNHTLYLAAIAKAKVYSFEPNIQLVDAINKSAEASALQENIIVHSIGLGSTETSGHFKEQLVENLGAQSIELGEGDIHIQPLDSIKFSSVSMIKIDVEGMEMDVLKGAVATIKQHLPAMYVEALTLEEFLAIEKFLAGLGYIVLETFNASPTHLFIHISKLDNKVLEQYSSNKIIKTSYHFPQELKATKERLHQANIKYRNINEQVVQLKSKLEDTALEKKGENGNYHVVKSLLDGREELIEKLSLLQGSADNKDQKLAIALAEIAKIGEKGNENYHIAKSLLDGREELIEKLSLLQGNAEKKEHQLSSVDTKIAYFTKQIHEYQNVVKEHQELFEQQFILSKMLHDKEIQFLKVSDENVILKGKILQMENNEKEIEQKVIPELKVTIQNLENEMEELKEALRDLEHSKNEASLAKVKAVKQVEEIRMSIMFQLGYALVNALLSFKGFISLPIRLLNIVKQGFNKLFDNKVKVAQRNHSDLTEKVKTQKPILSVKPPIELDGFKATKNLLKDQKSSLKVACIMDEFTYGSYAPTCNLQQLTPDNWQTELKSFEPELLFIESAWRGKEELWGSKVGHNSAELQGIIAWCKDNAIPTLFWNKEDPVHYQTFLTVAKQFDHVFTTDLDCVSRYKAALKHSNVYFLPFACQPKVHNPIEKFERKDAMSFAGAYYVKYPDRTKDLESFVSFLPKVKTLEIYDRNFGKDDPNYMFPPQYTPHIVGTLPFDKIDIAYKGYKYAINLNSIKQSQTMFARRIYELLASNTLTISNYSKGIRLMFGDLVACSDSGAALSQTLTKWGENSDNVDKLRLAGLRKVLQEHTYQARLNYIEEKIFSKINTDTKTNVAVISFVKTMEQAKTVVSQFNNQTWQDKQLFLIVENTGCNIDILESNDIKIINYKERSNKTLIDFFENNNYLASFCTEDFYGENYLTDLMLNFSYLDVDAVGKGSWYNYNKSKSVKLVDNSESYTLVNTLTPLKSVINIESFSDVTLKKWKKSLTSQFAEKYTQFSADRFNYCQNGLGDISLVSNKVADIENLNKGASLIDLQHAAENALPMTHNAVETLLEYEILKNIFEKVKVSKIKLVFEDENIQITSTLDDGKHEYIYGNKPLDIGLFNPKLNEEEQKIQLYIDATPGLAVSFVLIYLDQQQQRIGHDILHTNQNKTLTLPHGVTYVKLGFRALSAGICEIKAIVLGQRNLQPSKIVSCSETLLVTNHYPSYQNLYRNGFVHSRVKAYKDKNVNVDVFRLWTDSNLSYHEFDGVDVSTGDADVLKQKLLDGNYRTILVHFLDSNMWDVLKDIPQDIKINIWVHGAEVQPWWRREYNYSTESELEIGKIQSNIRQEFWKEVLTPFPNNLYFIFVSKYFANEVMEDLKIEFPKHQYEVIHNPIDTQLFSYVEKSTEQRMKILSIRPYASAKYANDLSVKAVQILSSKPWFKELEFRFIGDGKLFDEILEPIRKYENVIIERGFLQHQEIADLHKSYGVFLCPTRMDAQGVSKDEAMSSGLVVISNSVTAIPEFIDSDCGLLAEGENYEQMAAGIEFLYENYKEFERLSLNASKRVRSQTAKDLIISQELDIINKPKLKS